MSDRTRAFYARWAGLYDVVARAIPGVGRWRAAAVDALELGNGDRVLEVGVGTGANVPYLERAVGESGRVVGVDATREMLAQARTSPVTSLVEGDATALPVDGSFDGVLASFVVGLFPSPADVVRSWFTQVEPGGRLVLLDAKPSETAAAPFVNPPFKLFVAASTPRGGRFERSPDSVLATRVEEARESISQDGVKVVDEEFAFGLVRVTAFEKPP